MRYNPASDLDIVAVHMAPVCRFTLPIVDVALLDVGLVGRDQLALYL